MAGGLGNTDPAAGSWGYDGGNGYDGKRTDKYVVWDTKGQCADSIRDIILVTSENGITLTSERTRRNCIDLSPEPVALSNDALVRYNPANLIDDKRPFDLFVAVALYAWATVWVLERWRESRPRSSARPLESSEETA